MSRASVSVWIVLVGMLACSPPPSKEAWSEDDIAQVNRAVGLMGRFEYDSAMKLLTPLVQEKPDQPDLAVNLAIATLNRQKEGDETTALHLLQKVLETHPDHVRANYCAGLLLIYQGRGEEARSHFERVMKQAPDDAFTFYHLGQIKLDAGDHEAAEAFFHGAKERNPYLRSAYYGLFRTARLGRHMEKARAALASFQKLKLNPRAALFEFKYSRMGPLAMVEPVGQLPD